MYAVIQTGGKQYRVQTGEILQVEKLEGDKGSSIRLDQVLLVAKPEGETTTLWVGKPFLSGAVVTAEIVGQGRGDKIRIVKMKRRKQYRRNTGHRQDYTQFLVTGIENGAGVKAALSDTDKQKKLSSFFTNLKPRIAKVKAALIGTEEKPIFQAKKKVTPKAAVKAATTMTKTAKKPAAKQKTGEK